MKENNCLTVLFTIHSGDAYVTYNDSNNHNNKDKKKLITNVRGRKQCSPTVKEFNTNIRK